MPALLTIGEVARRAGVRASAIRYYEEAGLLEEPERVGGKRRYDEEALRRLALIGGAKRAGFTLGEIRTLLHGFPAGTGLRVREPGRMRAATIPGVTCRDYPRSRFRGANALHQQADKPGLKDEVWRKPQIGSNKGISSFGNA